MGLDMYLIPTVKVESVDELIALEKRVNLSDDPIKEVLALKKEKELIYDIDTKLSDWGVLG